LITDCYSDINPLSLESDSYSSLVKVVQALVLALVEAIMNAHGKEYGFNNLEDGVEVYFDLTNRFLLQGFGNVILCRRNM
jgi:hypothetical protein